MKIVCLGDSLTAGYCVEPEECWVSLLQNESPNTWINAGISGDTTGGMLARLGPEAFSRKPDAVLFMGGTNDIALTCSFEQAKTNIMAMVNQCADRGVRPVVGIPIPLLDEPGNPWRAVTDLARAAAVSAEYIRWLNLFTGCFSLRRVDFSAGFEKAGSRLYLADGVHPSPEGHRVMADAVLRSGVFR